MRGHGPGSEKEQKFEAGGQTLLSFSAPSILTAPRASSRVACVAGVKRGRGSGKLGARGVVP